MRGGSSSNTKSGKTIWPVTNKRDKETMAKQTKSLQADTAQVYHSQSVNHPRLEARNNVKNNMLQSLITSEQSLTKQ